MDPAAVIGLLASCLTIASKTVSSLNDVYTLYQQYSSTHIEIQSLLGRVESVNTALSGLKRWKEKPSLRRFDAINSLESAIVSCSTVLCEIKKHAEKTKSEGVTAKIRHIWNKEFIKGFSDDMDSQINALNLLLLSIAL